MTTQGGARPPSWRRRMLEARWPMEAAALAMARLPGRLIGSGDGHPVLVLPGFTASDHSTLPLRMMLGGHGYSVNGWGLGRNLGPTERIMAGMRSRIEALHDEHGRRVSLIGWSLGGIYARILARERPELVRQVITLASPYRMVEGDRSAATPVWERLEHLHDGDLPLWGADEAARPALTVPATSVYTRDDGVVRWQFCIDETGTPTANPRAENIEVYGTHIGLGLNPAVIVAILDRLRQPEGGGWQPFQPPAGLWLWYPRPASWREPQGRRVA